jgi:hypothetical protein
MATSQAVDLLFKASIYKTFCNVQCRRTRAEIGPSSNKSDSKSGPLQIIKVVVVSFVFRLASVENIPTKGKCCISLHTILVVLAR